MARCRLRLVTIARRATLYRRAQREAESGSNTEANEGLRVASEYRGAGRESMRRGCLRGD
eukprot:617811-Pleurochrysis_carterae.AAC.1